MVEFTERELREIAEYDAAIEAESEAFAEDMVSDEFHKELDAMLEDLAMQALVGASDWENKKKIAENQRKYREAHKDEIAEYKRDYNPKYRADNREKYNAYMREYMREYKRGKRRRTSSPVTKVRKEVVTA